MDDCHRRTFLKIGIPAFVKVAGLLPAIGLTARKANARNGAWDENTPLHWDAFIEEIHRVAAVQQEASWNEDRYVEQAAAIARRLNIEDPAIRRIFAAYKNRNPHFPEFNMPHREHTFQVSIIQFEPGEVIRHHNHPGMTGVLLCASGELKVDNYDEVRDHEAGPLLLKRSGATVLAGGNVSTLTSKQRNIHQVRAEKFTQVIDIFAPPYDLQRSRDSNWYEVDPDPVEGHPDLFRATIK